MDLFATPSSSTRISFAKHISTSTTPRGRKKKVNQTRATAKSTKKKTAARLVTSTSLKSLLSAPLSVNTVFGNPSEFSDNSSLGSTTNYDDQDKQQACVIVSPKKLIKKSVHVHNSTNDTCTTTDKDKVIAPRNLLLYKRLPLPAHMHYIDKDFVQQWSWSVRLDLIMSHVYMLINVSTQETLCTGLRINDSHILVPSHHPSRDMTRCNLQRLPEVPKVKIPKHRHNYYSLYDKNTTDNNKGSDYSRLATLFVLSNDRPSYAFHPNVLQMPANSDGIEAESFLAKSWVLFAWQRSFVAISLSHLYQNPQNPAYHMASGGVCVTLVPSSLATSADTTSQNSNKNNNNKNKEIFVVSGMYLGGGAFASVAEIQSLGVRFHH